MQRTSQRATTLSLFLCSALWLTLGASAANATPVSRVDIVIWSTDPGSGQPTSGTALQKGGKAVIKTTYDPAVTPLMMTTVNGYPYWTVDLAGGAAPPNGGGLVSNGSSLDILIPLEGMDAGSPFIYASDEFSHGDYPGDPFPSERPQIHFNDAAGTDLLGFKMESLNFGPGGNFVQLKTEVASVSGVPTPSTVVQMRESDFDLIIRSVNGIVDSVSVQAEAGDALAYDAGNLTRTTDGGTFQNVDGTWQDNDLGAARSDKEDFLTHTWKNLGSVEGGATNVALVGSDQDADRPNIIPVPGDLQPPPSGTRTVEKVNKQVGIANSGLQSTTDVATWQVGVTEDLTDFNGGTDTVSVSYANAGPSANAGADLVFDASNLTKSTSGASMQDADLAVNATIAGFETVSSDFKVDGGSLPGNPNPVSPTTTNVNLNQSITLVQSGLTNTTDTNTLDLTATDNAGANDSDSALLSYNNSAPFVLSGAGVNETDDSITFSATFGDVDLAANALVVGFETLDLEFLYLGTQFLAGPGNVDYSTLLGIFGGNGIFEVVARATDFAGAHGTFAFDIEVVPEPGTGLLMGLGLGLLVMDRRRHRHRA
jgi:hypothetical protein